jgi:hypothetical protein
MARVCVFNVIRHSHTSHVSKQVRDSMLAGVSGAGAMVDSSIDMTAAVAAASEHSQLRRSLSSEYFAGKLPSEVGRCCNKLIVPCCCWCHHSRVLQVVFSSCIRLFCFVLILLVNSHLLSERSLQSQRRWHVTAAAAAAAGWTKAARAAAAEAFVVIALSIQHSATASRCSQTAGNNQHHHHQPHRHHQRRHHLLRRSHHQPPARSFPVFSCCLLNLLVSGIENP